MTEKILPDHVQKAWDSDWKGWCLVQTKYHERYLDSHLKLEKYESRNKKLELKIKSKLTWQERITGVINDKK